MKNKLEHILLSILLGLSVLLGLSFWLNTIFNFNIFCAKHWDEFATLQASKTPIATGFYVSFGVAIFIFIIGLYFIYRTTLKQVLKITPIPEPKHTDIKQQQEEKNEPQNTEPVVTYNRPPRLNLPNNMAQIAAQKHSQKETTVIQSGYTDQPSTSPYNPIISKIFTESGYIVKSNPTISGFTPNLFAIGNNEIVWIGAVDCDIDKMMNALHKLDSIFKETLEDISININAFILDTFNKYDSQNESLSIFKSMDELQTFITEHPADAIDNGDQESFDAYSEYIDTIIQYVKNL